MIDCRKSKFLSVNPTELGWGEYIARNNVFDSDHPVRVLGISTVRELVRGLLDVQQNQHAMPLPRECLASG